MYMKNVKLDSNGKMAVGNESKTLCFFITLSNNTDLAERWEK